MTDADYRAELDAADACAEKRRPARTCLECGCHGGHNTGCPADEDFEDEQEKDDE